VRLNCDDIKWMETEGNYTTINLVDAKRRVVRTPISELQQQLSAQQFVRIHKSYLVNTKYITEVRTNSVLIKELELPIGRTFQASVSDFLK
jgi:DNA-binding LytR/AlgR family response regulator